MSPSTHGGANVCPGLGDVAPRRKKGRVQTINILAISARFRRPRTFVWICWDAYLSGARRRLFHSSGLQGRPTWGPCFRFSKKRAPEPQNGGSLRHQTFPERQKIRYWYLTPFPSLVAIQSPWQVLLLRVPCAEPSLATTLVRKMGFTGRILSIDAKSLISTSICLSG